MNLLFATATDGNSSDWTTMTGWTRVNWVNGYASIALYYKVSTGASDQTATMTESASGGGAALLSIYEFSGFSAPAVDVFAGSATTSSGTTAAISSVPEVAFAAFTNSNGSAPSAYSNGFVTILSQPAGASYSLSSAYLVPSSIGPQSTTATFGSGFTTGIIATFKGATGATSGVLPNLFFSFF